MIDLILYLSALLLALYLGYRIGLRNRVFPLMNEGQAEALYFYLLKEEYRHMSDIKRARADRRKLRRTFNIQHDKNRDLDAWIEIKKGKA